MPKYLKWIELDSSALKSNIHEFHKLVKNKKVYSVVKANAYGHGLREAASVLKDDVYGFAVNHIDEALALRKEGIENPVLILGYTLKERLGELAGKNIAHVVYDKEAIGELGKLGEKVNVHIKVETGTSRQGVFVDDLLDFVKHIQKYPNIEIEGLYTHYANIEDTTDHSYAEKQLSEFRKSVELLEGSGVQIPIKHTACTAATILFPETYFDAVRVGIGTYGLWSSQETKVSAKEMGVEMPDLKPVMTWKTKIAQVKWLEEGTPIAYGLTHVTTRRTKIAVLPVGYSDGYDRKLSNNAYVVINGKRAPLLGRVMMNMIVVDVTDIEDVKAEDEVILLGNGGMSAEEMASRIGTINYEVVTRVNWDLSRVVI